MSDYYQRREFCIVQLRNVELGDCDQVEMSVVDGYDDYCSASLALDVLIKSTGRQNRIRLFDAKAINEFIVIYAHQFDPDNHGVMMINCGLLHTTTKKDQHGKVEQVKNVYMTLQAGLIVQLIVRDERGQDRELVYFYDKDSFDRVLAC